MRWDMWSGVMVPSKQMRVWSLLSVEVALKGSGERQCVARSGERAKGENRLGLRGQLLPLVMLASIEESAFLI